MNTKITLLFVVFSIPHLANAVFHPSRLADEGQITTLGLEYESQQFRALGAANVANEKAVVARRREELSAKNLIRAQQLHDQGHMTDVAFAAAQYSNLSDRMDIVKYKAELEVAEAEANVAKVLLLQEAHPEQDFRVELVEARIDVEKVKIRSLDAALVVAEENYRLLKSFAEHGELLGHRSVLADAQVESRKVKLAEAEARVRGINSQTELSRSYLENLEQTRRRLSKRVSQKN